MGTDRVEVVSPPVETALFGGETFFRFMLKLASHVEMHTFMSPILVRLPWSYS
jgi:hypothetical protein